MRDRRAIGRRKEKVDDARTDLLIAREKFDVADVAVKVNGHGLDRYGLTWVKAGAVGWPIDVNRRVAEAVFADEDSGAVVRGINRHEEARNAHGRNGVRRAGGKGRDDRFDALGNLIRRGFDADFGRA